MRSNVFDHLIGRARARATATVCAAGGSEFGKAFAVLVEDLDVGDLKAAQVDGKILGHGFSKWFRDRFQGRFEATSPGHQLSCFRNRLWIAVSLAVIVSVPSCFNDS